MKRILLFALYSMMINNIIASNLIPDYCRPVINSKNTVLVGKSAEYIFDKELKCLERKFRNIILCSQEEYASIDNIRRQLLDKKFKKLAISTHPNSIRKPQLIIYNQSAQRNALLLQKLLLTAELYYYTQEIAAALNLPTKPHSQITYNNYNNFITEIRYTMGKLLEYPEEDIQFSYQRGAYRYHTKTGISDEDLKNLTKILAWANDDENKKLWEDSFNNAKKVYEKWINFNKKFTDDQLKTQNDALNDFIQKVNPAYVAPTQAPIPMTPLQKPAFKQPTPWWKKSAAYIAAAIAAVGAATGITYLTRSQSASYENK